MTMEFKNNTNYTFSVYPPTIASKFKNVTVLGVMTYQLAKPHADLMALHMQYFPHLPPGTPDDPSVFEYVFVQFQNGETTVLSTAWIKENTIERADSFPLQILMPGVAPSDIPRIRDMLTVNGFIGYKLTNTASNEQV